MAARTCARVAWTTTPAFRERYLRGIKEAALPYLFPAQRKALKVVPAGTKIEDNPAIVQQKSRDFYWYSPVLKKQLETVTGDIVVTVSGDLPRAELEQVAGSLRPHAG